jgi:Methyltransferase domain
MSVSDSVSPNRIQDLSSGRVRRALRAVRELGLANIIALARQHGLRGSCAFAVNNVRHVIAHRIALEWDRRHGVDTAGSIQLDTLSITGPNQKFGNECVCTSPHSFDFMMRSLPRSLEGYAFVDVGAGKSRTLLLASRYDFAKVVGVEFASELVACAKRNIACFGADWQRCRDLSIVEADATQFAFPDTPLVIFFYNPFSREVFDVVLANISASLQATPRDCTIIYGSSSHNAIDWAKPAILASGCFVEVPADPMPFYFDAVRTIRFAVFRAITPA